MIMAVWFKSVIGVNEYEVGFFKDTLDVSKPFHPGLLAVNYWAIHRYQVTGENRTWEDVGSFQRPNVPLACRYDLIEGVEKLRIKMPPHFWAVQVADVAPVSVMVLIWK